MELKMKKKKIYVFCLFIFGILIVSPSYVLCQNEPNTQNISDIMALKLKQKLLLSDEQTAKVKVILSNYVSDYDKNQNSGNLQKTKGELEALFNGKQRDKFQIIENDFFDELNKRISSKM
jgi:hypothetical protein